MVVGGVNNRGYLDDVELASLDLVSSGPVPVVCQTSAPFRSKLPRELEQLTIRVIFFGEKGICFVFCDIHIVPQEMGLASPGCPLFAVVLRSKLATSTTSYSIRGSCPVSWVRRGRSAGTAAPTLGASSWRGDTGWSIRAWTTIC